MHTWRFRPLLLQKCRRGEYRQRCRCLLLLLVADKELSYDEISALVGQSPDAVRGKLHRARKAFAVLFNKTPETSR